MTVSILKALRPCVTGVVCHKAPSNKFESLILPCRSCRSRWHSKADRTQVWSRSSEWCSREKTAPLGEADPFCRLTRTSLRLEGSVTGFCVLDISNICFLSAQLKFCS